MRLKNAFVSRLFMMILSGLIGVGVGWAEELNPPFPTYDLGVVQVRIYTDYFGPPCRRMEPAMESLLRELLKKNVIRLTLVDMPLRSGTPFSSKVRLFPQYS